MRSSVRRLSHQAELKLCLTNRLKGSNSNNLNRSSMRPHSTTMLAEVGRFEFPQPEAVCYPAGQPFLHRVFGYRGVILFPWLARVHDIDAQKQGSNHGQESHQRSNPHPSLDGEFDWSKTSDNSHNYHADKNSKKRPKPVNNEQPFQSPNLTSGYNHHMTKYHPYYQVLIDTRDCPFVSHRTQTEVTGSVGMAWISGRTDNDKSVVGSIKGLDYVAHEDILPYTSHEDQPIQHGLHNRLFRYDPDATPLGGSKFTPSDRLERWQRKHNWLELSRVYRETTDNIRVTVIPFYLGHSTVENTYWWRYCIRLENFSDASVQLRERHWKIFSQTNMLQTIKGRGVVGVEPLLTKSEPAYQYSSHVNLQDKSGHMWGTFKMQRVTDGNTFECRIPAFSLESAIDATTPSNSRLRSLDDEEKVK